jgi:hypothetical protein
LLSLYGPGYSSIARVLQQVSDIFMAYHAAPDLQEFNWRLGSEISGINVGSMLQKPLNGWLLSVPNR